MIPVKLTIQGLYSYQKKQTIDFTKFTQANIFGIFGAVGSGKSTILEAITFALYGKTERLNLSGDNRNYNMMNLKSNELFIEFIFRNGKEGYEYMSVVKGKRNSKQFDDVKTLERSAYKKTNGAWEPVGPESLETVIGLSYENFKRTIIIPQGKFQEFLQLGNKERSQMMKELFNLDRYELFYKVVSLETKNNKELDNIGGKIQQLGEINPDQLAEKKQFLKTLESEIDLKNKELLQAQQIETEIRKTKDLTEKIFRSKETLEKLREQENFFMQLDDRIKIYEYCLLKFKNIIDNLKSIHLSAENYQKSISADESVLTDIKKQIAGLETVYESVKQDYANREILKQQADELLIIEKILKLTSSVNHLVIRIEKGEKICRENEKRLNELKQQQASDQLTIKKMRQEYPDMSLISTVRQWHTVNQMLLSTRANYEKEAKFIQGEIDHVNHNLILSAEEIQSGVKLSDPEEIIELFEVKKKGLSESLSELEKETAHLQVRKALEEYASNLKNGEPCPLCGSLSHPEILDAGNISESLQIKKKELEDLKKYISLIENTQKTVSGLQTKLSVKKEQLGQVKSKTDDVSEKLNSHAKSFRWDEIFRDEKQVTLVFSKAEELTVSLKQKEEELEKSFAALQSEEKDLQKSSALLETLRHELTASNAEISTLKDHLQILAFESYQNENPENLSLKRNELQKKYDDIGTAFKTCEEKLNGLSKDLNIVSGKLEANYKSLQQEEIRKQELNNHIQEQLKNSQFSSVSEIEAILNQNVEIEKEKNKLHQFRQSLEIAKNQLDVLLGELGDRSYNEAEHMKNISVIGELTSELVQRNQDFGKLQNEIKVLQENLKTMTELKVLAESLRGRAENLKTLKQLFKASGFVNFISSVYLQDLCNAANERFYRLTRHNLSLEMTIDNNFMVRDFMNGGKTRSVKTLSGGQTFQAALSLALALADNIQEISGSSQNFFFLDEGFGSLDKESLDIVFETLKSLRKENRIVGVISHVEEMQQEIDAHLKVINDEENGSIVKSSF